MQLAKQNSTNISKEHVENLEGMGVGGIHLTRNVR
jgi:hypothetical protein